MKTYELKHTRGIYYSFFLSYLLPEYEFMSYLKLLFIIKLSVQLNLWFECCIRQTLTKCLQQTYFVTYKILLQNNIGDYKSHRI